MNTNIKIGLILLIPALLGACDGKQQSSLVSEEAEESDSLISEVRPAEMDIEKDNWGKAVLIETFLKGYHPRWLQEGETVIYSNENFQGLWKSDLAGKNKIILSEDRGAGFAYAIKDGKLAYKGKNMAEVMLVDLHGESHEPVPAPDYDSPANWLQDGKEVAVKISTDLNSIILLKSGEEIDMQPLGISNYILAEISPHSEQILVKAAGKTVVISDFEGVILRELGDWDSAFWMSDQLIVFIERKDDGEQVLSSRIGLMDLANNNTYYIESPEGNLIESVSGMPGGNILIGHLADGTIFSVAKVKQLD